MAEYLKNGYLNIHDKRAPEIWGRVPDPEDILGTVLVQEGKMIGNTFEEMPTHRLLTRTGFLQMDDYLLDKLETTEKHLQSD